MQENLRDRDKNLKSSKLGKPNDFDCVYLIIMQELKESLTNKMFESETFQNWIMVDIIEHNCTF